MTRAHAVRLVARARGLDPREQRIEAHHRADGRCVLALSDRRNNRLTRKRTVIGTGRTWDEAARATGALMMAARADAPVADEQRRRRD